MAMGNVRLSGARALARALSTTLVFAAGAAMAAPPSLEFSIEVLSSRPDTIAGGDALVRISVPQNVPMQQATVTLNGVDITAQFTSDGQARTMTALVSGLALGDNQLAVAANGQGRGRPEAALTLVNHPIQGPVFSGPHQVPYFCA